VFNPLGMPKHPRSIEESESWIRDAKAREDSVDGIKWFLAGMGILGCLMFMIWAIIRPLV